MAQNGPACLSYDQIGLNYADLRKPDPRIAALIHQALGDARTILNVGAGTGSYEPADRLVTALEPSEIMIRQRPHGSAVVRGVAEHLPFPDKSFDAALALLTLHHWSDIRQGLAELRRVTGGPIVILTFKPSHKGCWLTDYLPGLISLDEDKMPSISNFEQWLGPVEVHPVPVPHDCTDGFLYAYWRRPHAYLDAQVRKAISAFWALGDISDALNRLKADLDSGAWVERYRNLLSLDRLDTGYRLVISRER